MDCLPKNPILEFEKDTLEYIRKKYGFDKTERMKEAVAILEDWVKKQEHFTKKDFPRRYLEATIITSKGSLERAKSKLDKMCTFRTILPQFFGNFDVNEDFQDLYKVGSFSLLPKLAPEHYRVAILKAFGSQYQPNAVLQVFRLLILVGEYLKANEYADGFIIIIDYRDTDLVEVLKVINPVDLQNGSTILKEGVGCRLKCVHLITNSKIVEILVSLLRQGMGLKVGNRIMAHCDVEELHNYIPRDILPEEYGGKEKSMKILFENALRELNSEKSREYLRQMSEAKTNEKLRQNNIFQNHYLGMPGSFRTLTVD